MAPKTRIAGIVVEGLSFDDCLVAGRQLADVIRDLPERPLLIISSDMNHFAADEENRRLDELALQAMESLDPVRLFQTVRDNPISMCGVLPAIIVMEALRELGQLTTTQRIAYATSADVSGDKSRVVGYAGMLIG